MDKTKLEAILAYMADGVIFVNTDGKIEFVNERARTLLGTSEEIVGNDVSACHPESMYNIVSDTLNRFRSGSDEVVEMMLEANDRDMSVSVTGVRSDGEYLGVLLTIRDVTEMMEREQELTILAGQLKVAQEELSTPVVQIWDRVLALPLIGALDNKRAETVTEILLDRIVATQSEIVILDITGVHSVDTNVTNHLMKVVYASRLLGAECIITGICPDIAQTMIHLGVDLGELITRADMQEGLEYAVERLRGKK